MIVIDNVSHFLFLPAVTLHKIIIIEESLASESLIICETTARMSSHHQSISLLLWNALLYPWLSLDLVKSKPLLWIDIQESLDYLYCLNGQK